MSLIAEDEFVNLLALEPQRVFNRKYAVYIWKDNIVPGWDRLVLLYLLFFLDPRIIFFEEMLSISQNIQFILNSATYSYTNFHLFCDWFRFVEK